MQGGIQNLLTIPLDNTASVLDFVSYLGGYNAHLRAFQAAEREFERGFVALGALGQQGAVSCTFENAWQGHILE